VIFVKWKNNPNGHLAQVKFAKKRFRQRIRLRLVVEFDTPCEMQSSTRSRDDVYSDSQSFHRSRFEHDRSTRSLVHLQAGTRSFCIHPNERVTETCRVDCSRVQTAAARFKTSVSEHNSVSPLTGIPRRFFCSEESSNLD